MMNPSPTTNEAFAVSPFMSFAGIEGSGSSQTDQKHRLWDWDSPNTSFFSTTHTLPLYTQKFTSTLPPILNSPPPFFSTSPLPFYFPPPPPSAVVIPEYPRGTTASSNFKLQDGPLGGFGGLGGGRIGLNLGQQAYFSSNDHCFLLFGRSAHNQTPRCQAEGCGADLSGVKHYHRRHKVCEFHSKAAVVFFPGGVQQRFCQQCSRFHSLPEFDDGKRSCRKRLAEHNRRRRKSQSQPSTKCSCASSAAFIAKPIEERKQPAAKGNKQLSSISKSNNCTEAVKLSIPSPRLEGQQIKKAVREYFSDSTLSLGGAFGVTQGLRDSTFVSEEEKASQYLQQQQQQLQLSHFSSPFASSNDFIEHQSHFNEGTQSGGEGSGMTDHNQSSILQLGQAIFEWDFI